MGFIFTPLRTLTALTILLIGMFIYQNIQTYWPAMYENTRIALLIFAAGFALWVLKANFQARVRTYTGLAVGAALLGASALALIEPYEVAGMLLKTFSSWKKAGFPILQSLEASFDTLSRYSITQQTALITSLLVGLTIPILTLIWLIILVIPDPNNRISKSGAWQAQWLSRLEITQLKHNTKGLPLGLHNGAILRYQPNPKQGWRSGHHAVIAGTRAGKGVSGVIPSIIDHQGSVAVLDIKGENFAITRRHREKLGREVIVLNPFGVHEPMQHRFNPLHYIRKDHLVRDIDVIAEGLIRPEHGNGSHFSEMAKSMVAAVLEHVITNSLKEAENYDLTTVMNTLFSSTFNETLQTWSNDPATYGIRISQTASTFLAAGENEQGAIKTTIKKAFDWARSDEMQAFLSESNCNLEDVFNDKADFFIVVPLDQIDAQSVFLRLLTNIILGMAVRQEGIRESNKNVLLVLDEFVRLGRMEKLVNIANVAAGAGIEALFITQDKGQIESVYGKGDTASILGSCVTIRIFGLGRAEIETAKWASEALGDQTVLSRTQQPTKFGEKRKYSVAEQRQKMMSSDQILEMKAGEMLLLMGSKRPLRTQAIISYKHAAYRGKLT